MTFVVYILNNKNSSNRHYLEISKKLIEKIHSLLNMGY